MGIIVKPTTEFTVESDRGMYELQVEVLFDSDPRLIRILSVPDEHSVEIAIDDWPEVSNKITEIIAAFKTA